MKKYGWYFIILYLFSIAVVNSYGGRVPYLLFYLLTALLVCCVLQIVIIALSMKVRLHIENASVIKNEDVHLGVIIENRTFFYYPYLKIEILNSDNIEIEMSELRCISVGAKEKKDIAVTVKCKYRGEYDVTLQYIEIYDFLNLFSWKKKLNDKKVITVYPKVAGIRCLGLNESPDDNAQELSDKNQGDGITVSDLRLYVLGDSMKKIHWKVSARTGELYVKNFETTIEARNVIILDLRPIDDIAFEDKIVEIGASIAYFSLQRQMKVDVLYFDQKLSSVSAESLSEFYFIYTLFAGIKFTSEYDAAMLIKEYVKNNRSNANVWLITAKINDTLVEQLNAIQFAGNQSALVLVSNDYNNSGEFKKLGGAGASYVVGCDDNLEEVFR